MIPKILSGNGFRGVLDYSMGETKNHELIDTNMMGENPRELSEEFSFARQKNARVKNPVFHSSISFHESDIVDNEKMKEISKEYLEKMGYKNTQFVVVKHNDAKHQHFHIIASRINEDGNKIKDNNEIRKSIKICRDLEKKHGLYEVNEIKNEKKKNYDRKEEELKNRTGVRFKKSEIKNLINNYLEKNETKSLTDFVNHLNENGVKAKFNIAKTGHVSGISFKSDKYTFKGSALGKEVTWNKLSSDLNYDKEKDKTALHLSSYLADKNYFAKNFSSTDKFYNHLLKQENLKSEEFNFEKSFAVLNKVNHEKLKPLYEKWDNGDYTNQPKEVLTNVARQLEEKERKEFNTKVEGINSNIPNFFNNNDKKEIFNNYLTKKISEKELDFTVNAINVNSKFLPKDIESNLGISGKEYFEHKLSTIQSRNIKNHDKDLKQKENQEKDRLKLNLLDYGKEKGLNIQKEIEKVNGLKFTDLELKELSKFNDGFKENKERNPIALVKKQEGLNKLDKFEMIINATEKLNKKHGLKISKEDVKTLLARTKETNFSDRVPALVKSFSHKIETGRIKKNENIVKFVETGLRNKKSTNTILTKSFFEDINKASLIAQEGTAGTKRRKPKQEEEQEQKQSRGID